MEQFSGGCLCHCLDCRKRHGALFHAAIFPQDEVTAGGETRDYAGRHICPRCGFSVFVRSEDEIGMHLGALDAPDQLVPACENWTVWRESWLPLFPLEKHDARCREASGRADDQTGAS